MKKTFVILAALTLCVGVVCAQQLEINQQTTCSLYNGSENTTSITTDADGTIYTAWMDKDTNMKVSKLQKGKPMEVFTVMQGMSKDNYHVRPSIAVDRKGHIHVSGNMHNKPWTYFVSDKPRDIHGFHKLVPPGTGVTYQQFFKDKNGELYVTFRHKVKKDMFSKGSSAGGVMRYDADTESFEMLGGTDHGFEKTLVWVNNGGIGTHYQKPAIRLHFDKTNRMHLVVTQIYDDPLYGKKAWDSHSHVLYAYSDDGGRTFRRIDGSKIESLPMSAANMTVVCHRPQTDIIAGATIGAFSPQRPVVSWRDRNEDGKVVNHVAMWNGKEWEELEVPMQQFSWILSNRRGETLFFSFRGQACVSDDRGCSFKKYPIQSPYSYAQCALDEEHYIRSGEIRFHVMNQKSDTITVFTVKR